MLQRFPRLRFHHYELTLVHCSISLVRYQTSIHHLLMVLWRRCSRLSVLFYILHKGGPCRNIPCFKPHYSTCVLTPFYMLPIALRVPLAARFARRRWNWPQRSLHTHCQRELLTSLLLLTIPESNLERRVGFVFGGLKVGR